VPSSLASLKENEMSVHKMNMEEMIAYADKLQLQNYDLRDRLNAAEDKLKVIQVILTQMVSLDTKIKELQNEFTKRSNS